MVKWLILQEDITALIWYMPNNRDANYMRQKLIELQGEINKLTITVGEFNTPLSEVDPACSKSLGHS